MQDLVDRAVTVTAGVSRDAFDNADNSFLASEPDFVRGIDASFFRINNQWGFKFFIYRDKRDENHEIQELLSAYGLAPKVGPRIDTKDGNGDEVYGFLTEIVKVGLKSEDFHKRDDIYPHKEITRELKEKIAELGYIASDLHISNIGHTKDGKYVVIDVGNFQRIFIF